MGESGSLEAATGRPLEHASASAVLRSLVDEASSDTVTVGEVVGAFGERAFGFLLILFSLPNCVPMPPGVAAIVGWPVLLFGAQMALGYRQPWLPAALMRKGFALSSVRKVIDLAEPRLRKLEAICRPRHIWAFGPLGDRLIGLFAILVAVSVLIPFPGTNFPPSIALVIVSIAVMEEDGLLLAGGLAIGLAGLAYTAAVTGTAVALSRAAIERLFGL